MAQCLCSLVSASLLPASPCPGVMFNKDVVAPGRMRRKIHNPRILLLDCPIEYKKGENQTNVEITKEEDWCVQNASASVSVSVCAAWGAAAVGASGACRRFSALSLAPFALGSRTAGQVIPNYFELLQNTCSYDFGVSASQQYVRYLCLPSVPASSISDCASCMLGLVRNGLNENSN